MKTFLLISTFFAGLILCNHAHAQKFGASLTGSAQLIQKNEHNIISFSPAFADGKTYVRWLVQNDEEDGIFIIERSPDGVEFQALGFKERIGSPLCVNLFYSFVDEAPMPGVTYYRLMQVSTDQSYAYSDIVRVKTGPSADAPRAGSASEK
jgi:hypothetical protein